MSQSAASRSAYKVEELLALRASASGSTVSLEKFPDEDVIKGSLRFSHTSLQRLLLLPNDRARAKSDIKAPPSLPSFPSPSHTAHFSLFSTAICPIHLAVLLSVLLRFTRVQTYLWSSLQPQPRVFITM